MPKTPTPAPTKTKTVPYDVADQLEAWDTSLLPMGNGRHFIALKALVRKTNDIEVGDQATIRFRVQDR